MLKIVIISRTIFPANSPRAHRATSLAAQLKKQGNEVKLYALLGKYDYSEFSKTTGITVCNLGKSKYGNGNSDNGKKDNKLLNKIGRYFGGRMVQFPEIELSYFTYKVLKGETNIDLLITIGAPYSIHWGAALFKSFRNEAYPKIWISDCGDPFMGNPLVSYPFYFKYVEKWWGRKTDYITIPIEGAKNAYYKEFHNKIRVVPQGFELPLGERVTYIENSIPTFCFSGVVYDKHRDPSNFLKYLVNQDFEFKFIVYTKTRHLFEKYQNLLKNKLIIRDYIPRDQLLEVLKKMDFLINITNSSAVQSPSKLIDYTISGRPILEVSSAFLEADNFQNFLKKDYSNQLVVPDIQRYNIENVAKQFLNLM